MIKKILALLIVLTVLQSCVFAKAAKNEDKNMTRTDICKENYKTLFGGEALPATGDDPEMMAILQKYIFGEVFTVGNLDIRTREMLTVTSLAVQQTMPQLKAHINAALNIGVTPIELRESIYQLAPFIGFPKTLNAISAMNEVFVANEIALPLENAETAAEETRYERGQAIQSPIYGNEIAERYAWLPDVFFAEIPKWLTELCFADFGTRKGLDEKTRELLTVVMLAAMGGAEVQVRSHALGAIKAGNTAEEIVCAIAHALPYMGMPRAFNALNCAKEILSKGE